MAKSYSVTPVLRTGTTVYIATFKNSTGKRVTKSLKTPEKSRALLIAAGLCELYEKDIKTSADTPFDVPLDAARLFFGDAETEVHASGIEEIMASVREQLKDYPAACRTKMLPVLLEREQLNRDNELQRLQIASLKRALKESQDGLAALQRSVLGRAIEAGKHVPALPKALELFEATMKAETTDFNAKVVTAVVNSFAKTLPTERKTAIDITADDIGRFLDTETAKGTEDKRAARRDAIRRRLGRFLNWSARRWKYPSQMLDIGAVKKAELKREKGEIHYHEQKDVEAAIKALPNDYWRCIVASLAYAGLQLAELAWLRVSDVHIAPDGKSGKFSIVTVDDDGERHLLKTDHRRREVNLHPTLLLPRIKAYLASESPGKTFLFAMPKDMRVGDRERWLVNTLSTALNGHRGGKRRKASAALLPKGMNAKSLRRTFGSLLLRSGKTTSEVSAAMGNTEAVVASNYGKLRGNEVEVNF